MEQQISAADILAKLVDFGVLAGACIVKLPQVMKIVRSRSVLGISEASVVVEWVGYSLSCWYNLLMRYPFSAWGESSFVALQSSVILFLFWWLADGIDLQPRLGALVAVLVVAFLANVIEVPTAVIAVIGLSPAGLFVVARVPQVLMNYQQGHTGQLAPATFALQLAGNAARLFTVLHDLGGDPVCLAQHGSAALLNAIILAQVVKYRRVNKVWSSRAECHSAHVLGMPK